MLGECQSSLDLKKTAISRKVTFLEKVTIDSDDVRVGIIVHSHDSFSSHSKFEFNFSSNLNDDYMQYLADISPIVSYLGEFVHQAMENLLKLNNIYLESNILSVREKECLCWAADGNTASEIASRLFVTESTVKFHFRKIMRKLGAKNTTHAITIAMLGGYIKPHSDDASLVGYQDGSSLSSTLS
ncbi:MAG: helix-turn-helix transcriptional regulator [Thiotrichaceae bacterium]